MKFFSFAAIALACFLTTVSARIQLAAPVNPVPGGKYTVTWTHDASDPAEFVLQLQLASDSWALGQFWYFTKTKDNKLDVIFQNTDPYSLNTRSTYRLTARNQSNVDQILGRSPDFKFVRYSVTPTSTTVTTSASTTTRSTTSAKPTTTSKSITSSTTTTVKSSSASTVTSSTSSKPVTTFTASNGTTQQTSQTTLELQPMTTTTSPGAEQTTPAPGGDGVLGNNTNAASVSGGAVHVGAVATVLIVGLVSSFV
ncbi:hypothetical protein H1R20_g4150, partial [Candolleomyces eurysporus]